MSWPYATSRHPRLQPADDRYGLELARPLVPERQIGELSAYQ
jgi:hypothetical protein